QGVKSIGWYIDDFDMVQVSTNITNFKIIGLARVYEEVQKLAQEYGIDVCGSELIGLVPHDALLEAGMYFQHKHHIVNKDVLESAVEYLGLNTIKSFDKQKQILEFVAQLQ
ncbi:MAG TPA: glutamate formimidoyltransferase, partial [Bacteroidales bacterium]|nr:glutamate formimidoyltransferase [Bacteroidales bacterium]